MSFGIKLRELRRERGLTQKALALELGISLRALAYYEGDKRRPPQDILLVMSRYFGVSANYLLYDSKNEDGFTYDELPADELIQQMGSLLAGGKLRTEDVDKFIEALTAIKQEAAERQRH